MAGKNGSTSSDRENLVQSAVPADVMRLVGGVRRRLWFNRFLVGLHDSLVVALVIVLALVLAAKAFPSLPDDSSTVIWSEKAATRSTICRAGRQVSQPKVWVKNWRVTGAASASSDASRSTGPRMSIRRLSHWFSDENRAT